MSEHQPILPPSQPPINVSQPPQPQDMDAEDSLGAVLEAGNPNMPPNNEAVEMDAAGGENNDNDDQQSDMDLDYLAESESDSETENEVNEANNANNPDNAGK